jgi:hypothetical protein
MALMRILSSTLLALFLLFGQQVAAIHALKHVTEEQSAKQKKSPSHAYDCDECLSYAQLGGGINSDALSFDFLDSSTQTYAFPLLTFFTRQALPALARGPPASLA